MDDIDDITSHRSEGRHQNTSVRDIDSSGNSRERSINVPSRDRPDQKRHKQQSSHLHSRHLNSDEPIPDISPSRDIVETMLRIDQQAKGRTRLPMSSAQHATSVRVIPDISNSRSRSRGSSRTHDSHNSHRSYGSARSYKPQNYGGATSRPDKNMTNSERAYMWRMKFQRLNARNPRIPIPDTNNPDSLEKLYAEAIRTNHYCSTSSTWLIYMGLGYGLFQAGLHWMGVKLPPDFVYIQMQVMSHYTDILKSLGDPGGPSLGSSWPPWLKLAFVMCIHTVIFVLIYKLTGSVNGAKSVQSFICKTGLMGGKAQGEEVEADNAMANVGDMLGGLGGIFGGSGGGGLGGMFQNLIGGMMGAMGTQDHVAKVDLENPDMSASDRSVASSSREFDSRKETPFD